MTARNILLAAHIVTAILTIGWLAMNSMMIPPLIRQGTDGLPLLRFLHGRAGKVGPVAGVVALLGLVLVARSSDDYRYSLKQGWLGVSLVLFVVAMVNGAVFENKLTAKAIAQIEAGHDARDLAGKVSMLSGLGGLILITIVYLMVAKPDF